MSINYHHHHITIHLIIHLIIHLYNHSSSLHLLLPYTLSLIKTL